MIPGNSKSLWDAVKIAKDLNIEPIPTNMYGEGELLTHADMPDHFASFFNKINFYINGDYRFLIQIAMCCFYCNKKYVFS